MICFVISTHVGENWLFPSSSQGIYSTPSLGSLIALLFFFKRKLALIFLLQFLSFYLETMNFKVYKKKILTTDFLLVKICIIYLYF